VDAMHKRKKLGFECLENRLALATSIVEYDDIGYFFNSDSNIVQRYDIEHESWIDAIALQNTLSGPLVVHVDADGIYAAFGQSVYRYQSDGSGKSHLINLQSPVTGIYSDGSLLFLDYSNSSYLRWASINKTDNLLVDALDNPNYYWGAFTCSIATSLNSILCRSSAGSGWSLYRITYSDTGKFTGTSNSSSYYGDYSIVTRTWVFPDDSKFMDDAGNIFATSDLRFINRLSHIDDLDFLEDQLLFTLKENELTAYNKAFLPTGKKVLISPATKIFVNDLSLIAFFQDQSADHGYRTQVILVSSFNPADPNEPIDPTGLVFTPDWTEVTNQGSVLLLSKSHQNIFIWNPMGRTYQRSIGLLGSPSALTYDRVSDLVYVAYESGLVYKIDLQSADPKETAFTRLPGKPHALTVASDFIFAVDRPVNDYNYTYRVLSQDGDTLSTWSFYYSATEFVWNPVNRCIYFTQGGGYPTNLFYQEIDYHGILKAPFTSSYYASTDLIPPIHLTSDGKTVLLSSGVMYDANTLKRMTYALANNFADAVWFAGRWVSIRNIAGVPQLQEWVGNTFEPRNVMQWNGGKAYSIQQLTSKRVVVIHMPSNGIPSFTILDESLNAATVNNTWHNFDSPMDVDDDEFVSPLDILIMIDQINQYGSRQTVNVGEHYCDVDDDGVITPLDVLAVINWINIQEANESKPSGEDPDFRMSIQLSSEDWFELWRKRNPPMLR
jgi:hypothetical protein